MTEEGRFPSLFPALNWYDIMLKDKTWNQTWQRQFKRRWKSRTLLRVCQL